MIDDFQTLAVPTRDGLHYPSPGEDVPALVQHGRDTTRNADEQVIRVTAGQDGEHLTLWDGQSRTAREFANHVRLHPGFDEDRRVVLETGTVEARAIQDVARLFGNAEIRPRQEHVPSNDQADLSPGLPPSDDSRRAVPDDPRP